MKIYAKQVPPEYQESPLFSFGDEIWNEPPYNKIILDGNKQFISHTTEAYRLILERTEDLADELREVKAENTWDVVKDYFPELDLTGRSLSVIVDEVHRFYTMRNCREDCICGMLTALTGTDYSHCVIRGACQSDWQIMHYPTDEWDYDSIRAFECMYYNNGTEWLVDDNDYGTMIPIPENLDGYYTYSCEWQSDAIKKQIADECNAKPEDVVLYCFDGWVKIPAYNKV